MCIPLLLLTMPEDIISSAGHSSPGNHHPYVWRYVQQTLCYISPFFPSFSWPQLICKWSETLNTLLLRMAINIRNWRTDGFETWRWTLQESSKKCFVHGYCTNGWKTKGYQMFPVWGFGACALRPCCELRYNRWYSELTVRCSETSSSEGLSRSLLSLLAEMTARFEMTSSIGQRCILQYMLPWLANVELVDLSNSFPTPPELNIETEEEEEETDAMSPVKLEGEGWGSVEATQLVLNNLFYITVKVSATGF